MQLLSKLRSFICFNQKQAIKYEYVISERHKNLRIAFENKVDDKELEELFDSLIIDSYLEIVKIYNSNKPLIEDLFKELIKDDEPPRITVKTIQDNQEVLNIYRSSNPANFNLTKIKDNTGFKELLENNLYSYINNDISQSFIDGEYYNPRLDYNLKEELKNKEIEWKDCWKLEDEDKELGIETPEYYTSTLILPMSIRSDNDDKNEDSTFFNKFFKKINGQEDSRTVWGFLCFDHEKKDYFKNDEFINIGYIIADILSLYLMYYYNHVSGSITFQKIDDHLGNDK